MGPSAALSSLGHASRRGIRADAARRRFRHRRDPVRCRFEDGTAVLRVHRERHPQSGRRCPAGNGLADRGVASGDLLSYLLLDGSRLTGGYSVVLFDEDSVAKPDGTGEFTSTHPRHQFVMQSVVDLHADWGATPLGMTSAD